MDASPEDIFAEWYRRQMKNVARTASSYWVENSPRVWQAFPYQWLIDPPEEELQTLLSEQRGIAVRYSSPVISSSQKESYYVVFDEQDYGLDTLSSRVRKNIRRASLHCSVEVIGLRELADAGWSLQKETLERQKRTAGLNKSSWQEMCLAAGKLPGFKAWGCYVSGILAATLLGYRMGGWFYLLNQASLREYWPDMVNNYLTFEVTRRLVEDRGLSAIFYGLSSLDAPTSVDVFKFHMGYKPFPIRQRVYFHPHARWIASPMVYRFLSVFERMGISDYRLKKTLGLLRLGFQPEA